MKKVLHPRGLSFVVYILATISMTAFGVWAIFESAFYLKKDVFLGLIGLFSGIVGIILFGCLSLKLLICTRIELQNEQIFVHKGVGTKGKDLMQHEKRIKYAEISEIGFCFTATDSEGKSLMNILRPVFYLLFIDKNGKQYAISMDYYTKKQTILLIDTAILRCNEVGNSLSITSGKDFLLDAISQIKASVKREKVKKGKKRKK